jgi:hypothetical protein
MKVEVWDLYYRKIFTEEIKMKRIDQRAFDLNALDYGSYLFRVELPNGDHYSRVIEHKPPVIFVSN